MSRSRKKTPVIGHTMADSEKYDKKLANRTMRRNASKITSADRFEDTEHIHRKKDGNWLFKKDGKMYLDKSSIDRIDPSLFRKLIQK